jgi:hypothetical protein
MKRKHIRALVGGLSFTTALFVFQACYGMPQDMEHDTLLEGKVVSRTSGLPVKGIKVESDFEKNFVITNELGEFSFYTLRAPSLKLTIIDTDPNADGDYLSKDTTLVDPQDYHFLTIPIEEK